jgi:hypothetical protein
MMPKRAVCKDGPFLLPMPRLALYKPQFMELMKDKLMR